MWEETRNVPVRTFKWGVDSLHDVKFNPVQKDLLGIYLSLSSRLLVYIIYTKILLYFLNIYIFFLVVLFKYKILIINSELNFS